MSEKFSIHQPIPEGHRRISVEMDGGLRAPLRVEATIPGEGLYQTEAVRLSRKALRGSGYGPSNWSDAAGTVVKTREATEQVVMPWLNGSAAVTLREIHDATLPPAQSLREIQLVTVSDHGGETGGHRVYPTECIIYDPNSDEIFRWRIDDYHDSMDPAEVETVAASTRVEGGDRERLILYSRLRFTAGE